jgi:HPt (histidine-containing phosphotransfer) domain-containing protein
VWPPSCPRSRGAQRVFVSRPIKHRESPARLCVGGFAVRRSKLAGADFPDFAGTWGATMNNPKQTLSEPAWNHAELLERVDNDEELLRELLTIFKEDFPRTMRALESAIAVADWKNASRLSHTLKGMLSSLGARRAAAASAKLEQLAAVGESASLKEAFADLAREGASLLPELDAYMSEVRH